MCRRVSGAEGVIRVVVVMHHGGCKIDAAPQRRAIAWDSVLVWGEEKELGGHQGITKKLRAS